MWITDILYHNFKYALSIENIRDILLSDYGKVYSIELISKCLNIMSSTGIVYGYPNPYNHAVMLYRLNPEF